MFQPHGTRNLSCDWGAFSTGTNDLFALNCY